MGILGHTGGEIFVVLGFRENLSGAILGGWVA